MNGQGRVVDLGEHDRDDAPRFAGYFPQASICISTAGTDSQTRDKDATTRAQRVISMKPLRVNSLRVGSQAR